MILLLGCDGGDGGGLGGGEGGGTLDDVTVRLSEAIETVIVVSWPADLGADRVWIEYGGNDAFGQEAPAQREGEGWILGVAAETEVHVRVAAEVDGDVTYSDEQVITTGSVPSSMPDYEVEGEGGFGRFVTTSYYDVGPGESSIVFVSTDGDVVWHSVPQEGFVPAARPSRDGKSILYLWTESVVETEASRICTLPLSGEGETCVDTPYAHHDFVELADGSLAYIQEVFGEHRSYSLIGDAIVVRSPAGELTEVWNAFEDIEPRQESWWDDHILPNGVDWTHCNGMWYDEAQDDWYLSFYYFEDVRKIPGSTGTTEWVLGGSDSDFTIRGQSFGPQHAPQAIDGGILLFDNSNQGSASRVVSYALDTNAMSAQQGISWENPDGRHANVLGDAHLMDNGFLAAAYGDVGQLVVFDSQGRDVWTYTPESGTSAAQVYAYESMYEMATE